jgi:hypothetical protein
MVQSTLLLRAVLDTRGTWTSIKILGTIEHINIKLSVGRNRIKSFSCDFKLSFDACPDGCLTFSIILLWRFWFLILTFVSSIHKISFKILRIILYMTTWIYRLLNLISYLRLSEY